MYKKIVLASNTSNQRSPRKYLDIKTCSLTLFLNFLKRSPCKAAQTLSIKNHTVQELQQIMASSSSKGLIEGTTSLLTEEKYSDLTITTLTGPFKVHKAIVCTQSKVLAAMCDGGFKETSTSILRLEHDDPATVERMITFLYTGNYDHGTNGKWEFILKGAKWFVGPMLEATTLVYSIADKYDIELLKALAKDKFELVASAACNCEEFAAVAAKVFNTTPDTDKGLRDIVSRICAENIDTILACKTWNDVLTDNGAMGLAIFKVARRDFRAEVYTVEKNDMACSTCILSRSTSSRSPSFSLPSVPTLPPSFLRRRGGI